MKTPMQEMLEYVQEEVQLFGSARQSLITKIKQLLEKEEEVMCEFADKYRDDSCFPTIYGDVSSKETTPEFFELTFKNKER